MVDNCPLLPNPLQENLDGDPLGDACDCDPVNGDVWSTPGEVRDLVIFHDSVIGWTELIWAPPVEPGTLLVAFDVLRSEVPFDFLGAALCLESDGFDLQAEDWAPMPPPGEAVYYLVRAKSPCPMDGTGTAGRDSSDHMAPPVHPRSGWLSMIFLPFRTTVTWRSTSVMSKVCHCPARFSAATVGAIRL